MKKIDVWDDLVPEDDGFYDDHDFGVTRGEEEEGPSGSTEPLASTPSFPPPTPSPKAVKVQSESNQEEMSTYFPPGYPNFSTFALSTVFVEGNITTKTGDSLLRLLKHPSFNPGEVAFSTTTQLRDAVEETLPTTVFLSSCHFSHLPKLCPLPKAPSRMENGDPA